MARNSSFITAACSAASRAARSRSSSRSRRSSSRLLSVWSRHTLANPSSVPPASRIALVTPAAQNRLPSFRTCQRSFDARPSAAAAASSSRSSPPAKSSGVKNAAMCRPTISSAAYPNTRCAPGFHEVTRPSGSSVWTAWSRSSGRADCPDPIFVPGRTYRFSTETGGYLSRA
ncbi:MAG: hypothetical protein AVDCRST_MAG64-569 [uncultured Phycisphaerae bacterium]|uniref:Uncharacterized protein n=1 Tax=uncultured Phycisphaerae bacterium TaxID=904963 RepID=A0A6J4NDX7_9BACT|nr:MAG: hypothetical protein AVDCRST_MAG64-569 [uncultured Phycisphaerae bacterium]